ncbi:guanitoxin biosynthesis L-enduracididine beta-hydroxylase GntD [Lentzea sp. BCCO 10_0856]|uniref:Guanitoxin biosynthesis L-enduracididine beta-hydroxylase GntD n=1 Tax=Lentzea miocenica TaxID=3095431 RepID=A0ABU4TB54_9PSEU|nr:guanitoxin biosynthesis L-enduracididine beta-hydroxylase GntD [Lentzea sp. BCCO 10_0856]MDX8035389.1 guanitoxin biosynthesis L-enduracididine beta-hydroxylase GntD [Lentzea sp. BCCO 10_0856]
MSTPKRIYHLSAEEAAEVENLTLRIAKEYTGPEDEQLLRDLPLLAAELPVGQRRFLRDFALEDQLGYCVIRGHALDDARIGPTPQHWRGRPTPTPEFAEEILILLHGSLLGEPFGWKTQQDARLVHDIFPIKGFETEQMGIGSTDTLTLHTEDAFHPWRADYLLLECLRNPDKIATIVSEPDLTSLDAEHLELLHEPNFLIRPDDSHLAKHNVTKGVDAEFSEIDEMKADDNRVAVLYGSRKHPYMRLDPYFMETPRDPAAREAMNAVNELLEASCLDVALEPGDILVINNHRLAHGRQAFQARYDGTDRWLKRVSITTDLRKSHERRASATARLI